MQELKLQTLTCHDTHDELQMLLIGQSCQAAW